MHDNYFKNFMFNSGNTMVLSTRRGFLLECVSIYVFFQRKVVMICTNQARQPPGCLQSTHADGHRAFRVRCDMETTPGSGWTIFRRRVDGSEDFYRNWNDYQTGFGNLSGEFWLGLDKIHRLSASGQNVLRVDLESFENETAYAVYESFSVGNGVAAYILNVGDYSGNDKY